MMNSSIIERVKGIAKLFFRRYPINFMLFISKVNLNIIGYMANLICDQIHELASKYTRRRKIHNILLHLF